MIITRLEPGSGEQGRWESPVWASGSAASEPRAACLPGPPSQEGKGTRVLHHPTYTIKAIPINNVFTVTPFRFLSPQKVSLSSEDLEWLPKPGKVKWLVQGQMVVW